MLQKLKISLQSCGYSYSLGRVEVRVQNCDGFWWF